MVRADVELLRGAYDALNRSEIDGALAVLDPAAQWHEHSTLPEAGVYQGRDSIEAFLQHFLDSWTEFHQDIEQIVDGGERVALVLHSRAIGKGSGIEVEARYVHVWTMRSGTGVRVDTYEDVEAALASIDAERTKAHP